MNQCPLLALMPFQMGIGKWIISIWPVDYYKGSSAIRSTGNAPVQIAAMVELKQA
jgi:hypothetical protein